MYILAYSAYLLALPCWSVCTLVCAFAYLIFSILCAFTGRQSGIPCICWSRVHLETTGTKTICSFGANTSTNVLCPCSRRISTGRSIYKSYNVSLRVPGLIVHVCNKRWVDNACYRCIYQIQLIERNLMLRSLQNHKSSKCSPFHG